MRFIITILGLLLATATTYAPTGPMMFGGTGTGTGTANTAPPPEPGAPEAVPLRINCGGPVHLDPADNTWEADRGFTGGLTTTSDGVTGGDALGQAPWQSYRYGACAYDFTFTNGTYLVSLGFAQTYPPQFSVGAQTFGVQIEAATVLTNYDIFAEVGGNTAATKSFVTTVADGHLNIALLDTGPDLPTLRWIMVEDYTASPPGDIVNLVLIAQDGAVAATFTPSANSTQTNIELDDNSGFTSPETHAATYSGASFSWANGTPVYARAEAVNAAGSSGWSATAGPVTPATATGILLKVATAANGGSDSNTGAPGSPFLTLARAQAELRTLTGRVTDGATTLPPGWDGARVELDAGTYYLAATLVQDERDSGSVSKPIVYAAEAGETVVVSGAKLVTASDWDAVTAGSDGYSQMDAAYRASMFQLNLATVSGLDASSISDNGTVWLPDYAMLIVGDQIKMMSRYPAGADETSEAWTAVAGWTDLVPATAGVVNWGEATQIQASGTTIGGWNLSGQDIFVMGRLGRESWSQYWQTVTALGTSGGNSTINFSLAASGSVNTDGVGGYQTFFAMRNMTNVIGKGEYAFRRTSNYMTYRPTDAEATAWSADGTRPTTSITNLQSVLTMGENEMPNAAANYVKFEGLVFEGARKWAINIFNSTGVSFTNCIVRNHGWGGWKVEDVTNFTIDGGETRWCMQVGGAIEGGDKTALTNANIVVQNCNFTEIGANLNGNITQALTFSNEAKTETSCGVLVDNVDFYRTRDVAIALGANTIMRNCVVDRAMMVTGDRGALEACGVQFPNYQYSNINVLVENNVFQNIIQHPRYNNNSHAATFAMYPESVAYWTIQDNQLINCTNGINMPAGKKNILRRNMATDCHLGHYKAAFTFGGRVSYIENETALPVDLAIHNVQAEPYLSAAPRLKDYRGFRRATASAANDTLTSMALGSPRIINFINGETIKMLYAPGGFGGLTSGTTYYVRDADLTTIKLAATLGGAAIDITSNGTDGWFGKPENAVICYQQEYTVVDNWQNAGSVVVRTSGMFRLTNGSTWATEDGYQVGVDPSQLNYPIGASLAGSGGLPTTGGGTVTFGSLAYTYP